MYQPSNIQCLELLIQSKVVDIDAVDAADGNTALHVAAKNDFIDCARLLLRARASLDIGKFTRPKESLILQLIMRHYNLCSLFQSTKKTKLLWKQRNFINGNLLPSLLVGFQFQNFACLCACFTYAFWTHIIWCYTWGSDSVAMTKFWSSEKCWNEWIKNKTAS